MLPPVEEFSSPRAWAYALLGIDGYLNAFQGERGAQAVRRQLAERPLGLFQRASSPAWPWFEPRATYANARLSEALLVCGWRLEHAEMQAAALRSLTWLAQVQRSKEGYFAPIGADGFYAQGGSKASFDQQPIEACAMISACLLAQRVTDKPRWDEEARRAFDWFLGQDQLQQPLYDAATGACRDGLHADRPNENRGAESTLSFLLALVEMRSAEPSARCDRPDTLTARREQNTP